MDSPELPNSQRSPEVARTAHRKGRKKGNRGAPSSKYLTFRSQSASPIKTVRAAMQLDACSIDARGSQLQGAD